MGASQIRGTITRHHGGRTVMNINGRKAKGCKAGTRRLYNGMQSGAWEGEKE